jgi:hypothetical protein
MRSRISSMTISTFQTMERYGKLEEMDRSFDVQFWQSQDPQARMDATWEMIVHAYRVKGIDVRKLRLQRTVEAFQRQRR